ncbi:hypothetical protein LTR17_006814 [Elasticomyces elasticus]|nr:hypothetical protein LTR17_006814 [Elasticomyces elasticus]
MADNDASTPPLLRLPRELQVQTLSYLFPQGLVIPMGPEVKTAKRRKLNRELQRQRDPKWKPPKKQFPAVLLAHSELYMAGVMSFWSSYTFAFEDPGSLAKSTDSARSEVLSSITSLRLGPITAMKMAPIVKCFAGRTERRRLITLAQCIRRLWRLSVGPIETESNEPDMVLLSIPECTLAKLRSVDMQYYFRCFSLDKLSVDVLSYAKNLHSGAWSEPSRPLDDVTCFEVNGDWFEAKAGEYWDDSVIEIGLSRAP